MAEKRKREEDLEGNTSPQAQHSTARTSLTVSQRATQSTRHRCPIPFFARAKSSDLPSNHRDASKDEGAQYSMAKALHERFQKVAYILLGRDGFPVSYNFSDDLAPSFPVVIRSMRWPIRNSEETCAWLQLNHKSQDMLYMIMYAAVTIYQKLSCNVSQEIWTKREKELSDEEMILLKNYGVECDSVSVMHHLARKRKKREMNAVANNLFHSTFCGESLEDAWLDALYNGMNNGVGRQAVEILFRSIINLVDKDEYNTGPLKILQVTSPLGSYAFNISSSHSSSSDRLLATSPPSKVVKLESNGHNDSGDKKRGNESLLCCWPPRVQEPHKQYVDLMVATQDSQSGNAKVLFLIEVLSAGKTELEAKQKFVKELIYVLQSQSEVFGMLFSTLYVHIYHAKREKDQEVSINHDVRRLFLDSANDDEEAEFSVGDFQRLVLDIYTCLVYGIKKIY